MTTAVSNVASPQETKMTGNLVNPGAPAADTLPVCATPTSQNALAPKSVNGSTKKQVSGLKLTLPMQKNRKTKDGTNTSSVSVPSAILVWTTEQISRSTTPTEVKTAS